MISVITITYNRADLIKETIRSVLNQSYTDFEYIIVDDGSEDNTEEVVKSFNDNRIKYYKLSKLGYLSKLRNYGMTKSSGEYIAFIDSDDLWEPTMLTDMYHALHHDKDSGFVMCELIIFSEKEILFQNIFSEKYKNQPPKKYYKELFTDTLFIISLCAMLFKKECLDKTGMLNEQLSCGDKDFVTRLAFHYNSKIINHTLVKVRKHSGSWSDTSVSFTNGEAAYKEELYTINEFYTSGIISKALFKKNSAVFHYKLAEEYFHLQKYSKAKPEFYNSLKNNPFNYKAILKYIWCVLNMSESNIASD